MQTINTNQSNRRSNATPFSVLTASAARYAMPEQEIDTNGEDAGSGGSKPATPSEVKKIIDTTFGTNAVDPNPGNNPPRLS